jgi:serine/alanine adding enzyme
MSIIESAYKSAKVIIRLLEGAEKVRWDSYVTKSDAASCYHLTVWKDIIEESFGHRTYYLFAEKDGNISGILPLVHLKSVLFGNFIVSLPYFNYGGVCADDPIIAGRLIEEAITIAKDANAEHIELRHTWSISNGMPVKIGKVSMRLPLANNRDALWKSFPSKLRSQIRKPEKLGMYSKIGQGDELDSFYKVFSTNMRDLGTPVYPKHFFRNIIRTFPDSAWICSVYTKDSSPVASGFLLGFKDRLEIPWASSLRRHNHLSPNMMLYWTSLQFACERGYGLFDFGRSTPGEGTYKFKEQWGAKPLQLYWHYWLKNGRPVPELNPKNPKYRMAIAFWKKLPVAIAEIIGPPIVKSLP